MDLDMTEVQNSLRERYSGKGVTFSQSQEVYVDIASCYEKELMKGDCTSHTVTAEFACKCFPQDERDDTRVIDIGAGTGMVAKELRKYGFKNIDALDPSVAMLAEAQKKELYDKYYIECITDKPLDIPAGTYDLVTACGIYAEEAHVSCEALKEMARLTKSGGFIVIVTRVAVIETIDKYKRLEPLMEQLEMDGILRRMSRYVWPNYGFNTPGVVWTLQKL